ncbi:MAG: protein-glutamate O-methyltransferase CheR [Pseudomonadales bacterium]|nr:protein-glutamate O-methyltransferase CheR [Pseudomonadales bacterium]
MQYQDSSADFDLFRGFLVEVCGIELSNDKEYLVASRLKKVMATYQLESLPDLVQRSRSHSGREILFAVIDAMTTNETLWFRDRHPFINLENTILPELSKNNSPIKIWSAACSSGQEPYSIAMTIEQYTENSSNPSLNYSIVATDVSESMLDKCRQGIYDEYAVGRGLPEEMKERYFHPDTNGVLKINNQIRKNIRFKAKNLIESFRDLGRFDVVFCRNVLIYFPHSVKLDILNRIFESLLPGGYLLVGGSESLAGMADRFEMVSCRSGIIYRKLQHPQSH